MLFNDNGYIKKNNLIKYPNDNFESLEAEALKCKRCQLREGCTQVVMGKGNIEKKIMFIGEGPGANEDKAGKPFVGRAGQLLNKIFSAVGIKRSEVYITNVVKCRPPGNRNPTTNEMEACTPILTAELELINPKVIVPMGSVALKFLIDDNLSITRTRGKWIKKGKFYFLPTFHPSYLLRNQSMKKPAWQDFKTIKKSIDRIEELKATGKLD